MLWHALREQELRPRDVRAGFGRAPHGPPHAAPKPPPRLGGHVPDHRRLAGLLQGFYACVSYNVLTNS